MNPRFIVIIALIATLSVPAYAQGSTNPSLGIMINSTINGVNTAIQHVPHGTAAYSSLEQSLTYLNTAKSLYSEGNYTGAQYYFSLAMNRSYEGVISAGGKPFTVPPGLNQSREVAFQYTSKLMTLVNAISNQTVRESIEANITAAMSLLQAAGNATQMAHNIAEARQMLGNANAQISHYAKHRFVNNFKSIFLPALQARARGLNSSEAQAFNYSVNFNVMQMENESIGQIMHEMMDYNQVISGKFVLPVGTIGTYKGLVYITLRFPLSLIRIGNETFVANYNVMPMHGHHVPRHFETVGVINSSYAYSYVMSNAGTQISIFPSNGAFQVVLEDVGAMGSIPSGVTVITYTRAPPGVHQQFNFSDFPFSG